MTGFLTGFSAAIAKRRAFTRTRDELRALPLDVKLDLDISGIEDKVAHRAVYGR